VTSEDAQRRQRLAPGAPVGVTEVMCRELVDAFYARVRADATTLVKPAPGSATASVRALFFGRVADACGRSLTVAIPKGGCTIKDLKSHVAEQVEGAGRALGEPCIRAAIDQVMAPNEAWVSPGQEVAFLSAYSGG
jgi:molybdopterin converting factor small subunit